MATYYVYSGATAGANTGADWTNAYLSLTTGFAAATVDGDVVLVHYTNQESPAVDTTLTALANVAIICVDKDSANAPTPQGTSGWFGSTSTAVQIRFAGAYRLYTYGLTLRMTGTATKNFVIGSTDGGHQEHASMYFWLGTGSSQTIVLGAGAAQSFVRLKDPTFRFGNVGQFINPGALCEFEGGSVSALGSAPTYLMRFNLSTAPQASVEWSGGDLSMVTSFIVGDSTASAGVLRLTNCKLGTGVAWIVGQTTANRSGAEVWVNDCHDGDTHTAIGHENSLGRTEISSAIYYTAGSAGVSWLVQTTPSASFYTPYRTPWFGVYNSNTSAVQPYIEILRNGSTSAYQDDEVWGEFQTKATSGSTMTTHTNDRKGLVATAANQATGAGLGAWSGESGTAWSGKCVSTSVTPAEPGFMLARLAVGEPSIAVYLNPDLLQ